MKQQGKKLSLKKVIALLMSMLIFAGMFTVLASAVEAVDTENQDVVIVDSEKELPCKNPVTKLCLWANENYQTSGIGTFIVAIHTIYHLIRDLSKIAK